MFVTGVFASNSAYPVPYSSVLFFPCPEWLCFGIQIMLNQSLQRFARLPILQIETPLEKLDRLSQVLGREIYVKRDDATPFALGGNKVRKLEYLGAAAIEAGADVLITAGAIQSNHVRQTAALAARLGMDCVALLENPIATSDANYLTNGNRLLLDLFGTTVRMVDNLDQADQQLQVVAAEYQAKGRRPYVVPIGGSNALGALGYVRCGLELARQAKAQQLSFSAVVLPSGSAGTHAGLALALAQVMPETPVVGVTVSRTVSEQSPKVEKLLQDLAALLAPAPLVGAQVNLWDGYFAPGYGFPNPAGLDAIQQLARLEGLLLDPVYTGKAMAGLIDQVSSGGIPGNGPVLFLHTGGSPALFAYHQG